MRVFSITLLLLVSAGGTCKEVSFVTDDGVSVFAELTHAADRGPEAPIVILFHQAGGDGRGEYSPIVPRLHAAGYHTLLVDQRVGGDRFGGVNRTLAERGETDEGYCDAYPDLVAALDFVIENGHRGPIALWGSSYSAALVIRLGAERGGDVDAVLAFSPASGGPMKDCQPGEVLSQLDVPVLALRPENEFEIESVQRQMADFESHGLQTYVANFESGRGSHGSSMLVPDRAGSNTDATWNVVLDFLDDAFTR